MATHVVCPLCGKSSSLRSFPSVAAPDLRLQSFRGKGRGRGFEAIPAGSGLGDDKLVGAVRDKVVEIAQALERQGAPSPAHSTPDMADAQLRGQIASLERELVHERASREFLEGEVSKLEVQLERDRHLRLNTLAQVGKLASQLDRAKSTQDQMLAASRQCVGSLRVLREQLKDLPFGSQSLAPLVHDLKGLVDLIQDLRVVSSIQSAAADGFLMR